MNRYRKTEKDIHRKIYKYVIKCFREVVRNIPKSIENYVIIRQLPASLTSVGANDTEADASLSLPDFILKYSIVRKEMKETLYWLAIVNDIKLGVEIDVTSHLKKGQEILNIVSTILTKCKLKLASNS